MAGQPDASQVLPNGANGNAVLDTSGTSEADAVPAAPGLSADEIALYDRQIRLWGAQAQERIRSANILLISLRALGTEIAKNLTLAGIRSLTIIDDEPVTEEDLGAGYFLREEDVGKPRAEAAIPRIQELNPRVSITSDGSLANLLGKDQTYYTPFSVVIANDHDFNTLSMINTTARFAGRPFYAASIHGMYGFIFADLVSHDYILEREKSNIPTAITAETLTRSVLTATSKKEPSGKVTEIVTKRETYCPLILANSSPLTPDIPHNRRKLKAVPALLPCLRALFEFQRAYARLPSHTSQDLATFTSLATTKSRELQLPAETLRAEFLRSFIQNIGAEVVTTAAFVGGRLSEDVINVLGKREQPIQNFALFDADALQAPMYCLYSPPPELAMMGALNDLAPLPAHAGAQVLPAAGVNGSALDGGGVSGMGVQPADVGNGASRENFFGANGSAGLAGDGASGVDTAGVLQQQPQQPQPQSGP